MSNDWIKVRMNLHSHPKVIRIMSAVCPQNVRSTIGQTAARCMIVGALHAAWSLFDSHSVDGVLDGYGRVELDEAVGIDGFAAAMEAVGWLKVDGMCLRMRDFDSHNGKGAKRRAEDTASKRVRRMSEECPQNVRTESGPEKRREEKNTKTPPNPQGGTESGDDTPRKHKRLIPDYTEKFQQFWSQYPATRRVNKVGTFKIWIKQNIERTDKPTYDVLMRGLAAWNKCHEWTKEGGRFVCMPTTFLNQCRWSNQPPSAPQEVIQ